MSYVVSVARDTPIGEAELEEFANNSGAFETERSDGFLILHWRDSAEGKRESFVLTDGSLDITSPSDAALVAAQEIAARLGARVVGEEGEDLSDVDLSGNVTVSSGCGAVAGSIAIVAILLIAYWLLA